MAKISINLLPPEYTTELQKRVRFYKIQVAGIASILLVAFLASSTIALRILQVQDIKQAQTRISQAELRINEYKDSQASLLLLKNRLTAISQYLGVSSKQTTLYNLVTELLPSSLVVSSMTVDRSGNVSVLGLLQNAPIIDEILNSLLSKDKNEDKIQSVTLETLSRGRDGVYRISFKIKAK